MPKHSLAVGNQVSWGMTPALWQSIGLLGMNTLDLARFAQAQAEDNPFLRVTPAPGRTPGQAPAAALPQRDFAYTETLHEAVSRQIAQQEWEEAEEAVAYRFVEALEPWGWISTTPGAVGAAAAVPAELAERVLARLQRLEPAGLFARGLAECLSLQLAERGRLGHDERAVLAALDDGTEVTPAALAERCGLSRDAVLAVLALLRGLDPKPGAAFATGAPVAVTPDLIVTRDGAGWRVDLNNSELPGISVDHRLMKQNRARARSGDLADLRRAYGTARWLAEAIRRRNETVLAIAAELVRRQVGFIEAGPGVLGPLSQRDVAQALSLSESTVSRVVRAAWAQLPRGVVSLGDFFATAVSGPGATVSAPMVREMIARRISAEDPSRPYSDEALTEWLASQEVLVARRTVAKYRAALGLPGCRQRRRAGGQAQPTLADG